MITAKENPKAPHNQPFNIKGTKNKTKKNAWWQHPPYNNNKGSKDASRT